MKTIAPAAPSAGPSGERLLNRSVLSWALYDLANTIFSMNIVSLYMSLWVINEMGGTDATWGYVNSLSMLLMLVTAPVLGALSDQAGRRKPFLLASTLLCVAFTLLLGTGGLDTSLVLFIAANYFFQAGLVFYDAMLPVVSTPENRGRVGGIGIALGYVGSLLGVAAGILLLRHIGYVGIFRVTGLMFLAFALPIFLFVREPAGRIGFRLDLDTFTGALRQIGDTVRHVRRYRGLGRFLVGRAFYADAANTLIVFMGVYVTNEVGFGETETQVLMLTATFAGVVGGFLLGRVVDRVGPKKTLNGVLFLWMAVLAATIAIAVLDMPKPLFYAVACAAGIALGGTWASDRPFMLVLSPPARLGEFYGLYSLVGRFAAVVGPALWALIADTLGMGRPAAVGGLLVMVVIAWIVLRPVDDRPREWGPEDLLEPAA